MELREVREAEERAHYPEGEVETLLEALSQLTAEDPQEGLVLREQVEAGRLGADPQDALCPLDLQVHAVVVEGICVVINVSQVRVGQQGLLVPRRALQQLGLLAPLLVPFRVLLLVPLLVLVVLRRLRVALLLLLHLHEGVQQPLDLPNLGRGDVLALLHDLGGQSRDLASLESARYPDHLLAGAALGLEGVPEVVEVVDLRRVVDYEGKLVRVHVDGA
mmetsp:Transcript_16280/g.47600  ORF Transcript_16280/g.47600 Transcript_16280/m.47600 type:complete len:219 (-) Transcript_16280:80-736(-)